MAFLNLLAFSLQCLPDLIFFTSLEAASSGPSGRRFVCSLRQRESAGAISNVCRSGARAPSELR